MALAASTIQAIRWDGRRLSLLDQTRLPGAEVWVTPASAAEVADAIRRLVVRGAPNIGIAAAYGVALELSARPSLGALEEACDADCAEAGCDAAAMEPDDAAAGCAAMERMDCCEPEGEMDASGSWGRG